MIIYIFLGLLAIILFLQFWVSPRASGHLFLKYEFDTKLAEPGEKIVCTGRLMNDWFLPVTYINYTDYMPEGARGEDGKPVKDAHRLYLMPHRIFKHSLSFSLPERGVYRSGKFYLETGDFLGFKTWVRSGDIHANITVMPRMCEDEEVLNTLGGYLGDISVRRFIIEDPVLTIGYLDYTGREPMKKISWPHSAKSGRLMVKNSDFTVDADVAVILNQTSGSAAQKEKTLEIVRTVCEQLEELRIPYSFLSNGDTGSLARGLGKRHINSLMTALGRSRLFSFTGLDRLIDRCLTERRSDRSYIVVTAPLSDADRSHLARLQKFCDHELCILEAEAD